MRVMGMDTKSPFAVLPIKMKSHISAQAMKAMKTGDAMKAKPSAMRLGWIGCAVLAIH